MTEQAHRREPMRELAQAIGAVNEASERVDAAQAELEEARESLRRSLRDAHEAGASYTLLARIVGTSRQYITRIVYGTGGGAMLALALTAATARPAILGASAVTPRRHQPVVTATQRTRRATLESVRRGFKSQDGFLRFNGTNNPSRPDLLSDRRLPLAANRVDRASG